MIIKTPNSADSIFLQNLITRHLPGCCTAVLLPLNSTLSLGIVVSFIAICPWYTIFCLIFNDILKNIVWTIYQRPSISKRNPRMTPKIRTFLYLIYVYLFIWFMPVIQITKGSLYRQNVIWKLGKECLMITGLWRHWDRLSAQRQAPKWGLYWRVICWQITGFVCKASWAIWEVGTLAV